MTEELLAALDVPTPRYTSYPTADRFTSVTPQDYGRALRAADTSDGSAWTLYVHLPFCKSLCLYCGCNVRVTHNRTLMQSYLNAILAEAEEVASQLETRRKVASLHFGGGTPNYYSSEDLGGLVHGLKSHFDFVDDAEIAIELDPRLATESLVPALQQYGFNRVSFGIQDFDPMVQRAINRVCDYRKAVRLRDLASSSGFRSTNFDLIYGLPYQTPQTFKQTMRMVIEANPDRVALYAFAFVPWLKKHQRVLESGLPDRWTRWRLFDLAYSSLVDAGYVAIGMDHFAKPDDELAIALSERTLRRSFQGYTASEQAETLAFGASAIGRVGNTYVQNERDVSDYLTRIEQDGMATIRGLTRTHDDERHGWIIEQLMCFSDVSGEEYETRFNESFQVEHQEALSALSTDPLAALVARADGEGVSANPLGQRFIRRVAAPFDPKLKARALSSGGRYSKTV